MSAPVSIQHSPCSRRLLFLGAICASFGALGAGPRPPPVQAVEEPGEPGAPKTSLRELIAQLGSRQWALRETAQERLLGEGVGVAEWLEEASRSGNLEQAYRARHILEEIDPSIFEARFFKILLGDAPRVSGLSLGTGPEGKELLSTSVEMIDDAGQEASQAPGAPAAQAAALDVNPGSFDFHGAVFGVRCSAVHGAEALLEVDEVFHGTSRDELRRLVSPLDAFILVKEGDESLYRRLGLRMERERYPYVVVMKVRQGRRSVLGRAPLPLRPAEALEEIIQELVAQSRGAEAGAARGARQILALLGPALAARGVGLDPSPGEAALVAALVADDLEGIAKALEDPMPPLAEADGLQPDLVLRGATRLMEQNDARGLKVSLRVLAGGDASRLHEAMGLVADRARHWTAGAPSATTELRESERRAIIEAVYSEAFLGTVLWDDVEAEYLLAVASELLGAPSKARPGASAPARSPRVEGEDEAATGALVTLERLARRELGPLTPAPRASLSQWRRVARRIEPPRSELGFLISLLVSPLEDAEIPQVLTLLEESFAVGQEGLREPGKVGDEEIKALVSGLVGLIESDSPRTSYLAVQTLVRISAGLSPGPGQLVILLRGLLDAGDAASGSPGAAAGSALRDPPPRLSQVAAFLRQLETELLRWTGVPPEPRRAGALTKAFTSAPWRAWIEGPGNIAQREADWLNGQIPPAAGFGSASGRQETRAADNAGKKEPLPFIYYEFDLLLGSESSGSGGCDVTDGRRVRVAPGQPVVLRDRWGNPVNVLVSADQPAAPGRVPRLRVNSRPYTLGTPSITTIQGRELDLFWRETTRGRLGSRSMSKIDSRSYRSLVALCPAESEEGDPPPTASTMELWRWFLARQLLTSPDTSDPQRMSIILGILRILKIEESAPLLKALLRSRPSVDIAQQLHDLGDDEGLRYLRSLLQGSEPQTRLRAALALCEVGAEEGVDALLEAARAKNPALRGLAYQAANALDRFLKASSGNERARRRVLGLLVSWAGDPEFQQAQYRAFQVLEGVAGTDFGFSAARTLDSADERAASVARAIEALSAWWESQSPPQER